MPTHEWVCRGAGLSTRTKAIQGIRSHIGTERGSGNDVSPIDAKHGDGPGQQITISHQLFVDSAMNPSAQVGRSSHRATNANQKFKAHFITTTRNKASGTIKYVYMESLFQAANSSPILRKRVLKIVELSNPNIKSWHTASLDHH